MGNELIPNLPAGWKSMQLIDCTTDNVISYGIVQPGQHTDGGIPIIRVNNFGNGQLDLSTVLKVTPEIESKFSRTRLAGGEVLLTLVGSTGQSIVAPPELAGWNVPRAVAVIRVADYVGANWINICLQTEFTKHFLDSRANTTVQKTLNLSDVKKIPIPIPPKSIKEFIESNITSLEKKIELNCQTNQTLEKMAQVLFKSWFVDFDPVIDNALAAGNTIPDELQDRAQRRQQQLTKPDHKPLPDEIRQLFPSEFELTEELGWVPKGWGVESLDKIAHYQNGLALQKFRPEDEADFLPVLKIAHLKQGYTDGKEKASSDIKPSCIVNDGDIVFSWSGSLMIDIWCGGKAALNQHLFKVTSETYPRWFYYLLTTHHLVEFQRIAADKAVTMGHIKREHLSQAKCAVPSRSLIKAGSKHIESIIEQQVMLRQESKGLEKLRDTLLPKLISGELRLPSEALDESEQQLADAIA